MTDFLFVDSGTGGLPYLEHLKKVCPSASCVYIADNKNFPYGTKNHSEIVECITATLETYIPLYKPRAVVVACNTISVNALEDLRSYFKDIPFVGTVPAIKVAAGLTKTRRIGLLATKATVENPYVMRLKEEFASDCTLVLRDDTSLIDFIERHSFSATEKENDEACIPAVNYFLENQVDAIILGCTHFLNLKENFQRVAKDKAVIVDSREGVVKRALSVVKIDCSGEKALDTPAKLIITGDKKDYVEVCKRYNLAL
ncbi:MAG: glutamate racemase [Treponema sp.]|nr:glutamate racemase [Treponema sp.]